MINNYNERYQKTTIRSSFEDTQGKKSLSFIKSPVRIAMRACFFCGARIITKFSPSLQNDKIYKQGKTKRTKNYLHFFKSTYFK